MFFRRRRSSNHKEKGGGGGGEHIKRKKLFARIRKRLSLSERSDDPTSILPAAAEMIPEIMVSEPEVAPFKLPLQLDTLSLDVLAGLLSYLTVREIAPASLVSKRLRDASRSDDLWRILFARRWNLGTACHALERQDQNWFRAYQQAYHNPHDLWIFHWNCTYPQDGLVPGRCCIYDTSASSAIEEEQGEEDWQDLCPNCRCFPKHPLNHAKKEFLKGDKKTSVRPCTNFTDAVAQATHDSLQEFCQQHEAFLQPHQHTTISRSRATKTKNIPCYSTSRSQKAFANASTLHRRLDTQQYTAAPPSSSTTKKRATTRTKTTSSSTANTTYLSPLKDVLFFNVTEEPLSTKLGLEELKHLRQERETQKAWEDQYGSSYLRGARHSRGHTHSGHRPPEWIKTPGTKRWSSILILYDPSSFVVPYKDPIALWSFRRKDICRQANLAS